MLRARGFDVATTLEAVRLGESDESQLTFAVEQGHAVVTHNRIDFVRLHSEYARAGERHWGIIIAPQQRHRALAVTRDRLLEVLHRFGNLLMPRRQRQIGLDCVNGGALRSQVAGRADLIGPRSDSPTVPAILRGGRRRSNQKCNARAE